jgi:hypothetical protein
MNDRIKEERIKAIVLNLQKASTHKNHVRSIGLAARWAELLTKKRFGNMSRQSETQKERKRASQQTD